MLRKPNAPTATILPNGFSHQVMVEAGRATARLKYDTATGKVIVTILGIKIPVENAVDVPH